MVIDGSDERWGVCRIEETFFQTLEDALLYANTMTRPSTIVMLQNYTLPQGEYVIPRQTVLLIPSDMDQDYGYGINGERTSENNLTVYPFLRLTLDDGVNMRCEGRIEASGRQHTNKSPHGSVYASYGVLELKRDARLVIEADGTLISWGFVTGDGQVEVLKGGTTYEPFQIGDWKGGNVAADLFERKDIPLQPVFRTEHRGSDHLPLRSQSLRSNLYQFDRNPASCIHNQCGGTIGVDF